MRSHTVPTHLTVHHLRTITLGALIFLALLVTTHWLLSKQPAYAATPQESPAAITAAKPAGGGEGVHNLNTNLYYGTIQAAIDSPSTQNGHTLSVSIGTFTETVNVTKSLTIQGAGAGQTIVDGNHTGRPFTIPASVTVTIANLTIQHGAGAGCADYNGTCAGGLYNGGTLALSSVRVISNTAQSTGGGLMNEGTLTLIHSTLMGNQASDGGAVSNYGRLTVSSSGFLNNTAFQGGGIFNAGTLTVSMSTLTSNQADIGGGISNYGAVSVNSSTLLSNTATYGGGILTYRALVVINSTLSGNSASGAYTAGAIDTYGSNFYPAPARTSLTNVTFANNAASGSESAADAHTIRESDSEARLDITNTVLASKGVNVLSLFGSFNGAVITSHGHNLSRDAGGGFLTASGDMTNTNALLAPLGDYGGPTQTHALYCGSPAIDHGDNSVIGAPLNLTSDQRGFPRNGAVDIGAYEVQPHTLLLSLIRAGDLVTATATYAGADPMPDGQRVTFAASRGTPEFLTGTTSHGVAHVTFFAHFGDIGTVNASDACGTSASKTLTARYLPLVTGESHQPTDGATSRFSGPHPARFCLIHADGHAYGCVTEAGS